MYSSGKIEIQALCIRVLDPALIEHTIHTVVVVVITMLVQAIHTAVKLVPTLLGHTIHNL